VAKLRHIALSVPDPEAAAKFFEQAFGMTRAGNAMRGVYMTDGVMNVALLNFGDEPIAGFEGKTGYHGLLHFGMWVDNLEDTDGRGRQLSHRPQGDQSQRILRGQVYDP
jgi:lactoylglutathione lyase